MVLGVEEKTGATEEFILPEFGRVNLAWFDVSKKYRGAIFRLNQETLKQIAEIVGFVANFDFAGIKSATVDLMKTEGFLAMEIEKNTKPTDIAVRYSRERWNMLDSSGKGDNLRPWIKTEFEAKYISEKVIGLVAEQLRIVPDKAGNFIIRVNFKDRTFGVIGEEQYSEQMPAGGFSPFTLPTEQMIVLAKQYEQEAQEAAEGESAEDEPGSAGGPPAPTPSASAEPSLESTSSPTTSEPASSSEVEAGGPPAPTPSPVSDPSLESTPTPTTSEPASSTAEASAGETPVSTAGDPSQQAMGSGRSVLPGSSPAASVDQPSANEPSVSEPGSAGVSPAPTPSPVSDPSLESTPTPTTSEPETPPSFFKHPIPEPKKQESIKEEAKKEEPKKEEPKKEEEPVPGSTKSLEKFITRKENRNLERERERERKSEYRREEPVETPRYATYSRSEVDAMLKQQTENIASALGGKISSQQRTFQDAVDKQEKSFSKLSDGFVVQFDQTRVRLETMTKQSEENVRTELETFKRDLSKELDQHRAQLNKTIVPVARFIEDKNAKPVEKAQKEIKSQTPSQSPSDAYGLKPLLIGNLVLMVITLSILFVSVMPDLAKMSELQQKLNEINSKLGGSSSSTSSPSSSTSGAGNVDASTSNPVSSSGN